MAQAIKGIDAQSVHRITSGQVVVDLQTAVKELVENSLDAGATNIEVRFKEYGIDSVEVIDNGSGICPNDYEAVALKHHTSKLASFEDLSSVMTFGFRGEALSSLCALSESVTVSTSTATEAPMGTVLEFDKTGKLTNKSGRTARQRGTTVTFTNLFKSLPVRRKELERNAKREFGKALNLLNAYALVPCANENKGVRLTCSNSVKGKKIAQLRTDGSRSTRASVSALWGPKSLENLVDLDLRFQVEMEKVILRRQGIKDKDAVRSIEVRVCGLVSKFVVGGGRSGTDRQFFFVNGRPCNPSKVQKAFNEVYRTFNANQSPFVVADFIVPTDSLDINVSPDKRTIFIHSENSLIQALKAALEEMFAPSRSTYNINTQNTTVFTTPQRTSSKEPLFIEDDDGDDTIGAPTSQDDGFGEPTLLQEPATEASATDPGARDSASLPPEETDNAARDETGDHRPMSPSATQMMMDVSESSPPSTPKPATRSSSASDHVSRTPPAASSSKRDTTSSTRPRVVQMVLSTENAAWNLRRSADSDSDRPRKKQKTDSGGARKASSGANKDLIKQLVDFARSGSQVTLCKDAEEEEIEEEDAEEVEEERMEPSEDLDQEADAIPSEPGDEESQRILSEDFAAHRDGNGLPSEGHEEDEASEAEAEAEAEDDIRDVNMADVSHVTGSVEQEDSEDDHLPDPIKEDAQTYEDIPVIDVSQLDDPSQFHLDTPSSHPVQDEDESAISDSSRGAPLSPEIVRTKDEDGISVHFDLDALTTSWQRLGQRLTSRRAAPVAAERTSAEQTALSRDARSTGTEEDGNASEVLSRVLDKADFLTMEVVGQFNKGFIITRLRKDQNGMGPGSVGSHLDDLFIVDQHAADEKYNFERLQATTRIEAQKLYRPLPLELTAADELIAVDNLDVLRDNGFEVAVDEENESGGNRQLNLVAQPISKNTVFDMKDLEELIHLIRDHPRGQMVRCSKARTLKAQQMLSVSFSLRI
ncbi:hypothetical protein EUX98_g4035 [Antrodiella citrinella]|uniref:DNA mismatch repair protein S5 domain-containing protein n=1 Tax=Antrodiella citrinella TaxID=2447956 RepID=A0A4S4N334_9APHY|nr:hypothetical protein EUX98_g4035 [Antrodiella citrinella]